MGCTSNMQGGYGVRIKLFLILAILVLMPIASANPTGLTYMDSTWSTYDADDGDLIALSPNKTILASSHDDSVILFNATSLEKIATFTMKRVAALEFSPDGTLLAVNKGSTVQLKESIKLIDIPTLSILDVGVLADDKAVDIAWSPDSQVIAAPGSEGDVELYREEDLSLKTTLGGVHNVDVTCIDYSSDGTHIITGDESGRYAIWDSQGVRQGDYRDFGQPLIDCKFTPDGTEYVLLDENGKISSKSTNGSDKLTINVDGANKIMFSESGTRMHVVAYSEEFKGLLTYEYDSFLVAKRTSFFHRAEDVEFKEDANSRLQTLYVAGGTGQIAVYLRDMIPFGFNQPGADLDGDLVPDNLDDDDDGDGIIDEWDEDYGCDAPEGTPCSRYPDLDKIRSIEISIGSQFIISDTITLPPEESSNIRNLSRMSIAKDQILSKHETELFADAMCANIDHGDVVDQWLESVSLSNGELGDGVVTCKINSGMELIQSADSTTQISISIITTFSYKNRVTFPVDISLSEQTLPTDGSISWLAPAHPIAVEFNGDGAKNHQIPLWWNNGEDLASATLEEEILPEPTFAENLVKWSLHPIAFVLYAGLLAIGLLLLIRRENKIDIDLDYDELAEEKPDNDDEEDEDVEESNVIADRTHKRSPPRKKHNLESNNMDNDTPPKRRKTAKSSDINKDGPIMKTKRKRLVSNNEEKTVVSKKKVVPSNTNQVKTRKVKQEIDTTEKTVTKRKTVKKEVAKEKKKTTKKRKPVKRKKKYSEVKLVDEDKLQEDLATDFLNNE